jgi:DNA-binding NarL/FixJ family response regulator
MTDPGHVSAPSHRDGAAAAQRDVSLSAPAHRDEAAAAQRDVDLSAPARRDGAAAEQGDPDAGPPAGTPIRVVLADDHAAVRAGLRLMLEQAADIEVVGEAADGAVATRQASALRPDVVLMDIRMPGTDGISATRAITEAGLADVLILTTFDIDEYVFGALRAGAAGFLLKSVEPGDLVTAVRHIAAGDGVIAPGVTRRLLTAFVATPPPPNAASHPALDRLTAREREILAALGRGLSNADLAATLAITEATAKTHVSRVLAKLGCTSRVQAAILAKELGLA